jgi:hypothetical protein
MPRPPSSPAVAGGSTPPWRGAFLPFREPWIDEDDIQEVVATLGSGSLAMGPKTLQLEHAFAGYVGARHAVALSRCGAGIHAALDTIGVRPGDEVITSVCAAPAIVAAILRCWWTSDRTTSPSIRRRSRPASPSGPGSCSRSTSAGRRATWTGSSSWRPVTG